MINKKGFTLVELLAVIVLLGILSMYAIPQVTNMLEGNKKKIYKNDAEKLISQAKYKIKSNSDNIDLPVTNNHCILLSLAYLDNNFDFKNTPSGKGEYLRDKSFVVVKYVSSTKSYTYYVQLIECTGKKCDDDTQYKKNVYRGYKLVSSSSLSSTGNLIDYSDVKDIDDVESSTKTTSGLVTYVSNITSCDSGGFDALYNKKSAEKEESYYEYET